MNGLSSACALQMHSVLSWGEARFGRDCPPGRFVKLTFDTNVRCTTESTLCVHFDQYSLRSNSLILYSIELLDEFTTSVE